MSETCISNKLRGDAEAAGPQTTLNREGLESFPSLGLSGSPHLLGQNCCGTSCTILAGPLQGAQETPEVPLPGRVT